MKSFAAVAASLLGMASMATAHIQMSSPTPLGKGRDYDMKSPMSPSQFPCRGHHRDFDSTKPVASWAAGSQQKVTLGGYATHGGGSCQISLSYDKGSSFTVIHSFIGKCPLVSTLPFKIPVDAPAGKAMLAWSWHNKIGNREMYMNCAAIEITGGGGLAAYSFSKRPKMFEANLGRCSVPERYDVEYPNPGPDLTRETSEGETYLPKGSGCDVRTGQPGPGNPPPGDEPTNPQPPRPQPTNSQPPRPQPTNPQPTNPQPPRPQPPRPKPVPAPPGRPGRRPCKRRARRH